MNSMLRKLQPLTLRLIALVAALTGLLAATPARGQNITFEIQTPLMVAEGEQFRIQFVVTSDGELTTDDFVSPEISGDVTILSEAVKSMGFFMNHDYVNNVSRNLLTNTYTFWVQAGAAGKINVGAATVTANGKAVKSNTAVIDVLGAGARTPGRGQSGGGQQQQGQQNPGQQPQSQLNRDDILLRMEVNKRDVYRGEPIVVSMKIYTQVNIVGFENAKYPSLNGFWAQQMDVNNSRENRETVNGKVYYSHVLRQWLLYPQRSGTVEIEAAELTAVAQIVTQAQSTGSPFDIFFGAPEVRNVSTRLSTSPIRINVKDLPRPQPEDFTGAVGQFELTAFTSGPTLAANSGGSVTLRLSGTGNFPLIEAPRMTLSQAAFEQYDMKMTERLNNTARGTTGERIYEFPFIARAEGNYTIDPFELSYFDPSAGRYVTLKTEPIRLEVTRDDRSGTGGLSVVSGVSKEDLRLLGSDIRFIRVNNPDLTFRAGLFVWSWGWWLLVLLTTGLFCTTLYLLQKNIRERADVRTVKTKKANSVALRRLKRAKGFMNSRKESEFFEEMLKALWGYMGDKLSIDVAGLNKERIRKELELRGVEQEESDELLSLISECEFAQYSPAGSIPMENAYQQALDMIGRFESKI